MNVQEAVDAWQAQFTGQPPVGFMLRFSHDGVWTRLHYLKDGAGRAALAQETTTRFDAVACSLFTGSTVLLLAMELDPTESDRAALRAMGAEPITPPDSWLAELSAYMPEAPRVEFYGATMTWRRGLLDALWAKVAMDTAGRVAIFSPATGDAFLPCGSGADLIIWGTDRRTKLRDRFRDWLNGEAAASRELARTGRR